MLFIRWFPAVAGMIMAALPSGVAAHGEHLSDVAQQTGTSIGRHSASQQENHAAIGDNYALVRQHEQLHKHRKQQQQRQRSMRSEAVVQASGRVVTQRQKYLPAGGGKLSAFVGGLCNEDLYRPSDLEAGFSQNAVAWTSDKETLCGHLAPKEWVTENVAGVGPPSHTFSQICKRGQHKQAIEPLAGILRDPNFICKGTDARLEFSTDWLLLADNNSVAVAPNTKRYFFDAGGSNFMDAMHFFVTTYRDRGITFDHIWVWEAQRRGVDEYWRDSPDELRAFWEPRLTFYDGVPVSANPGDAVNNPVNRVHQLCTEEDFCVFKLDIDTPSIERPLVQQLVAQADATRSSLDEFFFEHHVHGMMQAYGWASDVEGTFADSYNLFSQLRQLGVRAHSWI
mmetsp:Transcript_18498/g.36284  ORF Transcript_18498/g.36284 Transcript_18498/m.36284 type:complete len:396 (+) Transcript_18498:65-1252(+)